MEDFKNSVGNNDTCQRGTSIECIIADWSHSILYTVIDDWSRNIDWF